jgi:peptidyl-prolyl cis-trans isomerase C
MQVILLGQIKPLATVNGVVIPSVLFEKMVKADVDKGQKDSPELRKAIKDELISRELVVQDAQKKLLDSTPEAQEQFAQIRQNFLIELALADFIKKNPVKDMELKAEYDRQVSMLGEPDKLQEYQLSQIATKTQAEAKAVLSRVRKGEAFDKVAREISINPSKENGGSLGWVLPAQIIPAIGNVIVNLEKGAITAEPIETASGWNIIKVDDKRAYKVPTFEQSKEQLQVPVLQAKKAAFIKKLKDSAKISQ